jgi:3-deoxy-D-manno-octulosonic acid kinase
MEMPLTKKYLHYHFGSSRQLTDDQLKELLTHFQTERATGTSILGGRAPVITTVISGLGPVVIKQFMRGGLMRYFIKNKYLKCGKTRSQTEYEIMHKLRQIGICTLEPIAYAYRGFPLYSAWLITRKIKKTSTLAELSRQDIKRVTRIMAKVIEQIDRLIECRCTHVDLHPGNILVDQDNNIYIIDFDKGYFSSAKREKLYDIYCKRWQRSIIKHQLPVILDEMLQKGLYQNFESTTGCHVP